VVDPKDVPATAAPVRTRKLAGKTFDLDKLRDNVRKPR